MKKTLILLAIVLPALAFGQDNTEGRIVYVETVTMEYNFKGREGTEGMEHKMPKTRTYKKELLFNAEASVYQDYTLAEDESEDLSQGHNNWRKMWKGEDIYYTDLKTGKTVQQKDFMSKKFLIKADKEIAKWKITGQSKEILGHTCLEAELQDTGKKVTAWFSNAVQISSGPYGAGQLPGIIMEMTMMEGKIVITASEVEFRKLTEGELIEPDKGKVVTEEEFKVIKEEKRKEMREMYGEGGGRGGMHGGHH